MTKLPSLAGVLACASLAALLAGCKTMTSPDITSSIPADYRLRHPIAVREGAQVVNVFIGQRRGELTPMQRAEISAMASSWRREATGGVVIEVPAGTPNARAGHAAVREIRALLTAAGIPGHSIEVRPYQPEEPIRLATIKVKFPKMVAETGPCGLWPKDLGPTYDPVYWSNQPHWNHGCATQRNLAAQVENPADLVQPRAETPPLASRRATVLDKYRKGEPTATQNPDAQKGRISDIGQ
jgi:pilus assembly protein CpaD